MKDFCLDFSDYLVNQKNVSDNTLDSYLRDVEHFLAYLSQQGMDDPALVDEAQMERYVENPKHIEVQILGDHYGHVIHLFERDCSFQRKNQKIIEEAPCTALTRDNREKLLSQAVNAAKSIGSGN